MWKLILAGVLLFGGLTAPVRAAEKRIALVIGNGSYVAVPQLPNPPRDAELVAQTLRDVRFTDVMVANNLDREHLMRTLQTFATRAEDADWAVIYYAGHGIEVSGINYLVPTDARLEDDRSVQFEAIALQQALAAVEGARKLRLVILDACRDNPFLTQMKRTTASRSIGRGLARIEPDSGILVAYSAKEGQVALDGNGNNSPFVTALAKHIADPGLEINRVFRRVRGDVLTATRNKQEPFVYGSLPDEDFYFNGGEGAAVAAPKPAPRVKTLDDASPSVMRKDEHGGTGEQRVAALPRPVAPESSPMPQPGTAMPVLLDLDVSGSDMAYWGAQYTVAVVDKLGGSIDGYRCEMTFDSDRSAGKDYRIDSDRCDGMIVNILKGSKSGSMPYRVNIERTNGQHTSLKGSFWNPGYASVKTDVTYPASGGGPMHLGQSVRVRILPLRGVSIDSPDDQSCRWQADQMTGQEIHYASKNGCEAVFSIKPRSIIWSMIQRDGYKDQLTWVTVVDKNGMKMGFTEVKFSVAP